MKFIPGPLAAQLSGKAGGVVASHNRGGPYFRRRAKPVIVTGGHVDDVKSTFAQVSAAWADLGDAAREAWTLYSANNPVVDRLGQKITLDGHAQFVRINALQAAAGAAVLGLPPVTGPPTGFTHISLDGVVVSSIMDLHLTGAAVGSQSLLLLHAGIATSAARNYMTGRLKMCVLSAHANVSQINVIGMVQARLGTLQNGDFLHVQAGVYDPTTGLRSMPLSSSAQISGMP